VSAANTPPPLNLGVGDVDAEIVPEVGEEGRWQTLGEHVRELACAWHLDNVDLVYAHLFPGEVYVKLDVLRALVMDWIPSHVDRRYVVAENDRGLGDATVEFSEEMSELGALCVGVRNTSILGLGARPGNYCLSLGRPGDQCIAVEHGEARRRASGVRAPRPVRV
jgi:hypothetical protein